MRSSILTQRNKEVEMQVFFACIFAIAEFLDLVAKSGYKSLIIETHANFIADIHRSCGNEWIMRFMGFEFNIFMHYWVKRKKSTFWNFIVLFFLHFLKIQRHWNRFHATSPSLTSINNLSNPSCPLPPLIFSSTSHWLFKNSRTSKFAFEVNCWTRWLKIFLFICARISKSTFGQRPETMNGDLIFQVLQFI